MTEIRLALMYTFCIVAIVLIVAAIEEETFRAWNLGQAAIVSAVLALVVKQ